MDNPLAELIYEDYQGSRGTKTRDFDVTKLHYVIDKPKYMRTILIFRASFLCKVSPTRLNLSVSYGR